MKIPTAFLALAWCLSGQSVVAAPAVPTPIAQTAVSAEVPFDPPTDAKVRYRWEKSVLDDGKSDLAWSIDDYEFVETDDGYRLTVTPVSSGSNESDPFKLAIMKRLDELTRRPFVLRLNELGEIEQLEDADFYWETIFRVLKEESAKVAATKKDAAMPAVLENVLGMFERMPAEARQALLTESVQPVVEFANTKTEVGKPLTGSVETASPFGGTLNREVAINLKRVADDHAFLTLSSTVPRAELEKLMQGFLKQLTSLPADKRMEGEKAMSAFKDFKHDTRSEYEVSMGDGLLVDFSSTEVVQVSDGGGEKRKVTIRRLSRIN
jgi:hypothetical protein